MPYRLLAIHDEANLAALLATAAERGRHAVETVKTGSEALRRIMEERPDLVLVDMSLPDIDGLVWLKILRQTKEGKDLAVIVASRTHAEEGMAQAFELGADDFVCYQGFDPRELEARLHAVLRRRFQREEQLGGELTLGDVRLDAARHLCRVRGKRRSLRPREFELLEILMRKAGRVLSRPYLLESVWGMSATADTRTVDVTVSRLRKTLGKRTGAWLETVERFGYRFRDPDDKNR